MNVHSVSDEEVTLVIKQRSTVCHGAFVWALTNKARVLPFARQRDNADTIGKT